MSTNGAAPARTLLLLGHACADHVGGEVVPGGAALYAALQARALGWSPRVLTSAAEGYVAEGLLRELGARVVSSRATTTFDYATTKGLRRCALRSTAETLLAEHLPEAWRDSEIALVCPVWHEVSPELVAALRPRLLGLAPQGFLRKTGEGGEVMRAPWSPPREWLQRADAIFLSEHDADDARALGRAWSELGPCVVVTHGERGATLHRAGRAPHSIEPCAAREVDPTGAGDVFATSWLIARAEGASHEDAGRFAAAAAACSVEGVGQSALPTRDAIERRLRG